MDLLSTPSRARGAGVAGLEDTWQVSPPPMAKTYSDLLSDIKTAVKTVSLEEINRRLEQKTPMVLVDVREKEEYRAGYIPGAISIPRGFLEMQAEGKLTDKDAPIVAYCAGGTRSAFAAKTLQDLGYTHVETASPGFVQWKDRGFPMETPPALTEAQRDRYYGDAAASVFWRKDPGHIASLPADKGVAMKWGRGF